MATTALGYPYPLGTDRVMDGDDVIHALADTIDDKLGVSASGTVVIAVNALTTPGNTAVTFPAGRFTAPPHVMACSVVANPQQWQVSTNLATAAGVTVYTSRLSGSVPTNANVQWLAHQAGAAGALGRGVEATPTDEDEEPTRVATVICQTSECDNRGYPIDLLIVDVPDPAVVCGVCGQPITDIT